MQPLRNRTNGAATAEDCAREILDAVPLVMRYIRHQVRRHRIEGLSVPQFRTLAFLSRTEGASLSVVAEHLGLSLPATSRLVDGLVKGRFIVRDPSATDRRQVALAVAPRGAAAFAAARQAAQLQLADVVTGLSTTDRQIIRRAMRVLRETFDPQQLTNGSGLSSMRRNTVRRTNP